MQKNYKEKQVINSTFRIVVAGVGGELKEFPTFRVLESRQSTDPFPKLVVGTQLFLLVILNLIHIL